METVKKGYDEIEIVLALRHLTPGPSGLRHGCRCTVCKAIKTVCNLARERLQGIDYGG